MGRTNINDIQKAQERFAKKLKKYSEMEQFKYVYIHGEKTSFMISSFGRIFSLNYMRTGRIQQLKTMLNKDLHESIVIKHKGKNYSVRIHRLVAEAFVPNPENKPIVHHIDGDHLRNEPDNLVWLTESEHAVITTELEQRHGLIGEESPSCIYTEKQMLEVCRLLSENKLSLKEISEKTGVQYGAINLMRNKNSSRKDVKYVYDISKFNNFKNKKYSDDTVHKICKDFQTLNKKGLLSTHPTKWVFELSDKYKVSYGMVNAIRLKVRRRDICSQYDY